MMRLSIGYPEKESEITLTRNSLENKSIFAVLTLTPVISFAYAYHTQGSLLGEWVTPRLVFRYKLF